MLILELIFLVVTIPFASQLLSTIFPSGWKAFLIFVLTVFLYQENIQILGGLCQTNFIFAKGDISLLSTISYFQESLLTVPVIVYNNADTDKSHILTNTKGKTGIYLWTHKESNKMYIGSAINLSKRLSNYYSLGYLTRYSNSIICNALYSHGYSKFSLSIMEFIDTSNLNKDEIKKLILEKEQFYLDSFKPEYNILRIAGNLLGYKHSKETIKKMSLAKSGKNNPLYGFTFLLIIFTFN